MQTLIKPLPTLFPPKCQTTFSPPPSPLFLHPKPKLLRHKIQSTSKFGNFLSHKPDSKPESLPFDLSYVDPKNRRSPTGLHLSQLVSQHGVRVCCIDPSPLSMWPNNYGAWVDELQSLGLQDCFDKTWPIASVHINDEKTKYLDRPYGRVNRKQLKTKILQGCVTNGVKFHQAKVWKIHHQEFESSVVCDTGREIKASLIVDASGFASNFVEYDKHRNHGYQIAHGILAEVDEHPFDLDKMLLMDWRDSHLNNEPYLRVSNVKTPTFLYAMPFDKNLVFLEETSLVSRPALS